MPLLLTVQGAAVAAQPQEKDRKRNTSDDDWNETATAVASIVDVKMMRMGLFSPFLFWPARDFFGSHDLLGHDTNPFDSSASAQMAKRALLLTTDS